MKSKKGQVQKATQTYDLQKCLLKTQIVDIHIPIFISSNRVCIQKEYPNDIEQTVNNLVHVLNQLSSTQAFYSQITPHNDQIITL